MVDAIGVEQRWILYQAESATRRRVPNHQRNNDSLVQARPAKSSSIPIRIQLLNPTSSTTTKLTDVSLDGNRQTLTRGIRLKGHVGAAGKATVLWGELKAQTKSLWYKEPFSRF